MATGTWRVITPDGVLLYSRDRDEWIASTRTLTKAVVRFLTADGPWPALMERPETDEGQVLIALAVLYPEADFVGAPLDEVWPSVPDGAVI